MASLKVDTVNTNITEARATLTFDQIVETLGMRVGIEGKISTGDPGVTTKVEWSVPDADGAFSATVHVVKDHNYVAPAADPQSGQGASDGTGGPSPSVDGGQPVIPATVTIPQIPSTPRT